jgi:hypothetical protein
MTIPASPTNNEGGYYTSSVPVNSTPTAAPAAAVNVADTVPGPATFNAGNGDSTTQYYVSQLVAAAQCGTAFNNQTAVTPGTAPSGPSVGLKEDVQTKPSASSGSFTQQGTAHVSRATLLTQDCVSNPVNLG